MANYGASQRFIEESGCGVFQVLFVLVVDLIRQPTTFMIIFMSFGNFNPGWKCLDANSTNSLTHNNSNHISTAEIKLIETNTNTSNDYSIGSCSLYKSCQNVEFNPKTSTLVSEWKLICDKSWVPSFIISIQMVGLGVGCLVGGQLGDSFGRKKVLYISLAICGVLNLVSAFSPNWQTFAILRFFMGFFLTAVLTLYFVLPSEYMSPTWRVRISAMPSAHIAGILFALLAMWCENWKTLHIITATLCFVYCLPVIWVPESLRWLETHQKFKEFKKIVEKVNRFNRTIINTDEFVKQARESPERYTSLIDSKRKMTYTVFSIFRRNYVMNSLILGFLCISFGTIYFGITYSLKSMYGNLYINMILMFAIEIAFCIIPTTAPNIFGRRSSILVLYILCTLFFFVTMVFELWVSGDIQKYGTLILPLLSRAIIHGIWYILLVLTAEIYPTKVRSIALGYVNMSCRIGGVLAPLIVPSDDQSAYLSYMVMGILGFLCCYGAFKLPETKGRNMIDSFEDE